jgi:Fur family iron response transcriptional regulator
LVEGGLLREFRFPHSERVIYDCNTQDHYHFIDERSGELFDVEPGDVTVEPRLGKAFQIDRVEVLLRGRRRE